MQLWQLDVMGSVFLTDGTECKLISGVDDHSRFSVLADVVLRATGRAVRQAFVEALLAFGPALGIASPATLTRGSGARGGLE